jgi:hypothetical protein
MMETDNLIEIRKIIKRELKGRNKLHMERGGE